MIASDDEEGFFKANKSQLHNMWQTSAPSGGQELEG